MKRFRKSAALLLCMVMAVSSLSACKKSDDVKNSNSDGKVKEAVEIDYTEPAEYTYWLYATPGDYNSDYNNNPVVKYLNQKFNMTLSFQQPSSGTETDALNLLLGTGEYTDMIDSTYYPGSITQLYEEGVIIDIAQYLDYMPNLKALLESDETFRKNAYNDEGQLLKLPNMLSDEENMWGGLVYRRDILETMTGGNVAFPSGNDSPVTIADWDYMLPLMKQYFEAAGMKDYAPLILPAKGYFDSGDLVTGFGAASSYYVDNGTIKYGPVQDGFYNYLAKMREWYEEGYIYKDFATRSSDLFYLPNTALTYGGAAGVWFGLNSQLGDAMSQPDYGLIVDTEAAANPIDEDNGVTSAPSFLHTGKNEMAGGAMVTTSCENVERLLSAMDYLYSEEGSYLKGYGLTAEQGAAEDELYAANGMSDGIYTLSQDGTFKFNEKTTLMGGEIKISDLIDIRLPGLRNIKYINEYTKDIEKAASETWLSYSTVGKMPALIRTTEEEASYSANQSSIDDYINTMVLKFILGDEELNDSTWEEFKTQIESYGVEENIEIQQAAYDRYKAR